MHAQSVIRNCTVSTKKSLFWLDIFSSTAQLHMYYLQKLIDEYTNSFFLSGGGERGLTWRKIFIQCFEN